MLMEKHSFKNYDINDMEVFIMFIKVYLLLIALLFCVSGLYQFLTGNQTIISKKILQKYNLTNHFIKRHGLLYMINGCMIFGVMFFYNMLENTYVLYAGFIILEISYLIELLFIIKNQKNIDGIQSREIRKVCLLLFLIIIVTYFRPIPLSNLLEHAETIEISMQELGVDNGGVSYINESNRAVLSSQEKENIITVARQYSYCRNLSSVFKYEGSKKRHPAKILMLYVEENSQKKTIYITSMQEIIIDNHSYTMADSWEFIDYFQSPPFFD